MYNFNTDIAFDSLNNNYIEENIFGTIVLKSKIDDFDFYLFDYYKECYFIIKEILKKFINKYNLQDKSCLVVGLGNKDVTPDSLGPTVVDLVLQTRTNKESKNKISKITPGVLGNTGLESFEIIKGIVDISKPDFIIAIDALKSSSIERLNKSIQITDFGIKPGSGIKNERPEISKKFLNIPVIAIGVPVVVDIASVMNDVIVLLLKYLEQERLNKTSKLSVRPNLDVFVSDEIKKMYLGYVGELNEEDRLHLITSFLEHTNKNLIVSTKDIDFIINDMALEIAKAINFLFDKKY